MTAEREELVQVVDDPPRELDLARARDLVAELPVTFAGTPIANERAGMSPVTYEPDATIASAPIRQPA